MRFASSNSASPTLCPLSALSMTIARNVVTIHSSYVAAFMLP
jgi:hypothetical protein